MESWCCSFTRSHESGSFWAERIYLYIVSTRIKCHIWPALIRKVKHIKTYYNISRYEPLFPYHRKIFSFVLFFPSLVTGVIVGYNSTLTPECTLQFFYIFLFISLSGIASRGCVCVFHFYVLLSE